MQFSFGRTAGVWTWLCGGTGREQSANRCYKDLLIGLYKDSRDRMMVEYQENSSSWMFGESWNSLRTMQIGCLDFVTHIVPKLWGSWLNFLNWIIPGNRSWIVWAIMGAPPTLTATEVSQGTSSGRLEGGEATSSQLLHDSGLDLDWSPSEQASLDDGLAK